MASKQRPSVELIQDDHCPDLWTRTLSPAVHPPVWDSTVVAHLQQIVSNLQPMADSDQLAEQPHPPVLPSGSRWANELELDEVSDNHCSLHVGNITLRVFDSSDTHKAVSTFVGGDRITLLLQFEKSDALLAQLDDALQAEVNPINLSRQHSIESLTALLAAYLLQRETPAQDAQPQAADGLCKDQLTQVIHYIQAHLDQDLKLTHLAKIGGMSHYHFCRLFKQSMGITPHQYVLQQRVERAKQLLKQRRCAIADIALQCGFANQSHFNRHFKRLVGMTPRAFLRRGR